MCGPFLARSTFDAVMGPKVASIASAPTSTAQIIACPEFAGLNPIGSGKFREMEEKDER